MITNCFSFGARYSLCNVKDTQQAVFLCRQLCLFLKTWTHALSNGLLSFIPVSATAVPTSLIPVTDTQAAMPVIAPSTTTSNFQLLLFFHIHTYVPTHILPQSPEPQGVWHSAQEKKWGKKRRNNFRNKRLFMTHSSQTEQHSTRSASLAPEMGSTQPHQPTQLTAWGRPLEGSGPYMVSWEKHSQRKCCLRLNPAGSRGGSTPSTGSPATHLA